MPAPIKFLFDSWVYRAGIKKKKDKLEIKTKTKKTRLNSLPTSVLDSINERRKKNPETNRRPTAKGI